MSTLVPEPATESYVSLAYSSIFGWLMTSLVVVYILRRQRALHQVGRSTAA